MFADRRTEFAVTRGGDVVGVVTVDDFRELSKAEREADTVADLMEADLPRFPAAMAACDALVELDTARASAAFVDGPEGPVWSLGTTSPSRWCVARRLAGRRNECVPVRVVRAECTNRLDDQRTWTFRRRTRGRLSVRDVGKDGDATAVQLRTTQDAPANTSRRANRVRRTFVDLVGTDPP